MRTNANDIELTRTTYVDVCLARTALSLIRYGSSVIAIPLIRRRQYGLSLLLARHDRGRAEISARDDVSNRLVWGHIRAIQACRGASVAVTHYTLNTNCDNIATSESIMRPYSPDDRSRLMITLHGAKAFLCVKLFCDLILYTHSDSQFFMLHRTKGAFRWLICVASVVLLYD